MSIGKVLAAMSVCVACASPTTAAAQSDLRSGYFTTGDGVELHYLETGSGPLLVYVPGLLMPAEVWDAQLRYFAATHRAVALDPRSQGRSQRATDGHDFARRGADIGELIAHLEAGPAVVVGWSLGALEVLAYVQEFGTDALRAVVLVDRYLGPNPDPPHPLALRITSLQVQREQFTRQWVRSMFAKQHSDEYFESLVRAAMATPTNTAVTLMANLIHMEPSNWHPILDVLDRPLLFVARPVLADQAEMVRQRRPDAQIVILENAGHALFVDEPETFNRLLEDFLATLPQH
jgi:non-heme chloroperoxidase